MVVEPGDTPQSQRLRSAIADPTRRPKRSGADQVYRRWAWLHAHVTSYGWRQSWTPHQAAFLLVVIPLFAAGPLDNLLGPFHFELFDWHLLNAASGWAFAAALGGFCLINALIFEHLLGRQGRPDVEARTWVRALRFMLGGLPLVGLLVLIPNWGRLVEQSPRWAFRRLPQSPPLKLTECRRKSYRNVPFPAALELLIRRFEGSFLWPVWAFAMNFIVLLAISIWLGRPQPAPVRHVAAIILWSLLHFGAAFATVYHGRRQALRLQGPRARFLRLMPLLCLLPFSLVILLIFLVIETDRLRTETLTFAAYGPGTSVGRLPRWRQAQQDLRRDWLKLPLWARPGKTRGTEDTAEVSNVQRQLLSFFRLKTFALFFDGAFLGWTLAWTRQSLPEVATMVATVETSIVWIVGGIGVFGALWLTVEILRLLAGALRILPRRETLSRAWYLASGSLAALAGLYAGGHTGSNLEELANREIGLLVAYAAALCAMICGIRMVLFPVLKGGSREASETYPTILWAIFFMAMIFVGGLLMQGPEAAELCLDLVLLGAWSSPIWQLALGVWFLGWILHPLRPADLRSADLPSEVRDPLVFLAATAIAPWGGLAIPLWILLRHRLGPRMKAAWLKLNRARQELVDRDPLSCRQLPSVSAAP